MSNENLPALDMFRPDAPLPEYKLPEGYMVRPINAETEGAAWCECMINDMASEISQEYFNKTMVADENVPDGSVMVVENPDHVPVATATAQVKVKDGVKEAWLHMVSAKESERGKGLGMPVCIAALQKHQNDGLKGCYLVTNDWRLPAIYMYLKMGFLPVLAHESHRERWQKILKELGKESTKCLNEELLFEDDIIADK